MFPHCLRDQPLLRGRAAAVARIGDLATLFGERVDAQRGAEIGGGVRLDVLDRNARRIRDPIDRVESRCDARGITERRIAQLAADFGLDVGEALVVGAEDGVRERYQQRAVRDVAIALAAGE